MATTLVTKSVGERGEEQAEKGLKHGTLGLISSIVIGVASTAPAYSLASTLGFVVLAIGLQTPILAILAFIPMLFTSIGYNELNKADPDCGTTFTWASRAFGPKTGWWGGWGIVAADIIVMASLAQIAGQYVFLLFGADSIGNNANSGWVLAVGVLWIVVMGVVCYVGIEVSANFQKALLGIEFTMLVLLSIVALVKVGSGHAPPGHLTPAASWFNPFDVPSLSSFVNGILLMLFIYWGWDTAVSVNEETADANKTPGQAAVISTFLLLAIYALAIISVQSYAGLGTTGVGLGNPAHIGDVLSVLGGSIFGTTGFGSVLTHLLLLMVLSSAAASTQTTILPTARTTLSMAVYKAIPDEFGKVHRRFLTPTVSTVTMCLVSIILYVVMNFLGGANNVISDSIDALGVWIAFYYGLTGFTCAWYYRKTLRESSRNLLFRGVLPFLGGVILWAAMFYNFWYYYRPGNNYSTLTIFGLHVGGAFVIDFGAVLLGVILMLVSMPFLRQFFRGEIIPKSFAVPGSDAPSAPAAVAAPEIP
jgi:amino acid transporter